MLDSRSIERQQAIESLIHKYGMEYLDHLDWFELEDLVEEEIRHNER